MRSSDLCSLSGPDLSTSPLFFPPAKGFKNCQFHLSGHNFFSPLNELKCKINSPLVLVKLFSKMFLLLQMRFCSLNTLSIVVQILAEFANIL